MSSFGIQIEPQFGYEFSEIRRIANVALENEFDTVWFSDHFILNQDATDRILLDPWLVMSALSRENSDIRLGSLVFCNSYRNPALHAKMGASLDNLSGGRLEFGIGAGWKELDYEAYGIEYPDDLTRIEQLGEGIQIIKGAWTEEKFSFDGKYYSVKNLISEPKPVQQPHPTIWVGSMTGGDRIVEVAARYGNGLNLAWSFTPDECQEIFGKMTSMAKTHERKDELSKSVGLWTRWFKSKQEMEKKIEEVAKERNMEVADYRERVSSALWGDTEIIIQRVREYQEIGVTHFIFMFPYSEEESQIQAFGEYVLPAVK
ncbi:MAG: LLM class flavin-dependent oxidoreductase [Candidatus Lokiarchaeota archaeon]|nr:LLM class flavin-dependent oxidoreductase [Candidatus Lokiarchaeota archaeon]